MNSALRWGALTLLLLVTACGNGARSHEGGSFGTPCAATEDCASELCIALANSDAAVCTEICDDDTGCPAGWSCVLPDGADTRVCGCYAHDEEICGNRLDDDCNGLVDDCLVCDGEEVPSTVANCGACGETCVDGEQCVHGACECPAGRLACGELCVEPDTDEANCGGCGQACAEGATCVDGACACPAGVPDVCPGAGCVDLQRNRQYCGACDHPCIGGEAVCVDGACVCPTAGHELCGETCADLDTDEAHCGACGHACGVGQVCEGGSCTCAASGLSLCGDGCVDLAYDVAHCGTCDHACRSGEGCFEGVCGCPSSNETFCEGLGCVTLDSDTGACGSCTNACVTGERCTGGSCVCDSGQYCAGACTPVNDSANCGGCGIACRDDQLCSAGVCLCPVGYIECGGECVPSNDAHCGSCSNACVGEQHCDALAGACRCALGETFCPSTGECTVLATDRTNCGACGNECGGTATCASGACVCAGTSTYCGAAVGCVSTATDASNCGACGNACGAARTCSSGACVCPVAGQVYCAASASCVRLTTDASNCGACGNACGAARTCSSGACVCPIAGQVYCAGTDACVSTSTDASNCGACGHACSADQVCTSGACMCPAPVAATPVRWTSTSVDTRGVRTAASDSQVAIVWIENGTRPAVWLGLAAVDGTITTSVLVADTLSTGATIDVAWADGLWGVVWYDGISSQHFRRYDTTGAVVGSDLVWSGMAGSSRIAWSPATGFAVVAWQTRAVWLRLLGVDGSSPALINRFVTTSSYVGTQAEVAASASGELLVVHDVSDASSLVAQPINADGSVTATATSLGTFTTYDVGDVLWDGTTFVAGITVQSGSSYTHYLQRGPTLANRVTVATGTGYTNPLSVDARDHRLLVAWSLGTASTSSRTLQSARYVCPTTTAAPTLLTSPTTVLTTSTSTYDVPPSVAHAGDEAGVLVWADTRWGQTETYSMGLALGTCR